MPMHEDFDNFDQNIDNDDSGVDDELDDAKKKKGKKGPKTSKREQESISSGLLSIDVTLINEIKKVGLNPPVLRTDIEKFVKTLNQKLEEFTKLSVEEKNKFLQDKKAAEETNAASNNSNEAKAQVKTSSD